MFDRGLGCLMQCSGFSGERRRTKRRGGQGLSSEPTLGVARSAPFGFKERRRTATFCFFRNRLNLHGAVRGLAARILISCRTVMNYIERVGGFRSRDLGRSCDRYVAPCVITHHRRSRVQEDGGEETDEYVHMKKQHYSRASCRNMLPPISPSRSFPRLCVNGFR